jgi:hypothetical protein
MAKLEPVAGRIDCFEVNCVFSVVHSPAMLSFAQARESAFLSRSDLIENTDYKSMTLLAVLITLEGTTRGVRGNFASAFEQRTPRAARMRRQ